MSTQEVSNNLEFIGFGEDEERQYHCPFCGDIISIKKEVFYGRCKACHATLIDYKPLEHQKEFHKSSALYRLLMGGYGTGKTTMCVAEVAQHALEIPNGRTLITAPILNQVKEAILPELERFLPPWLIVSKKTSPTPKYSLRNGHEIVVFASNDDEKLRSLNLTAFYLEEASAVDLKIFHQLQARLRNTSAIIKDKHGKIISDRRMGIIASNPEQGWLVDDFLLYSNKIVASSSVDVGAYLKLQKEPQVAFETFLSSSRDNPYLPPGQIASMCAGKPLSWIRKYIDCSLEVRQGAVYPGFADCLEDDFPIPPTWKRVVGFDRGFNDETALLIGAIEPKKGIVHVYYEYYVALQPTSYHASELKKVLDGLPMYNAIQADPSVLHRSDRDGKSYQDYFYKLSGLFLAPANNSIIMGLDKVRDYMYTGKLKIFKSLINTKNEAMNYVYPSKDKVQKEELPVDKFNHLMDALRYMIMALPQNPFDMTKISSQFLNEKVYERFFRSDEEEEETNVYTFEGGAL